MEHRPLFTIMATPIEVAPVVDRRRWPVHVTLVGNFVLGPGQEEAVATDLAEAAGAVHAFDVPLGPTARFGAARDIPVLLAEHPIFHRLHAALTALLERLPGLAAAEPAFWKSGYRPHATLGTGVDAVEGDLLRVGWITLIALEGHRGRRLSAIRLAPR